MTRPTESSTVSPASARRGRQVTAAGRRVLVGRTSEMQCIERALESARSNSSYALGVVGEPGIGKSRLLEELCHRAESAGFEVLIGRGAELEQEVPFGIFVNALDGRFRSPAPEAAAHLGPDRLGELAAVFPSMAGRGGADQEPTRNGTLRVPSGRSRDIRAARVP
ncbi:ATP-binding protein [Nocardia sp. NPDC004168]|uniref:ATP-binding protein n=1 Tax=Nocardia sp. NPDC004168 TaxID=3154452 RepID=UPI0033BD7FF9